MFSTSILSVFHKFSPLYLNTRKREVFIAKLLREKRLHLFFVSPLDRKLFFQDHGIISDQNTTIIANGLPITDNLTVAAKDSDIYDIFEKLTKGKVKLVFIGSKTTQHNFQAVNRIIRIAKALENLNLDLFFVVIGYNWETIIESNLIIMGSIQNVDPFIQKCDFGFLPLSSGSGTKLKTLRILANGLPIIATEHAVEGLPLDPVEDYIPLKEKDFVDQLQTISSNSDLLLSRYKDRLDQKFEEFSWQNISEKLHKYLITNL